MTEVKIYYGDNLTTEQRSATMRAVKRRDTAPERALRAALRRQGITGYRIDVSDVPGRPDVAFKGRCLAVFVDGAYWHGRSDRLRPGRSSYWDAKIQRNVERDQKYNVALREHGWRVLRLWDDEVMRDPDAAARRVAKCLFARPMAEFFAGMGLVGLALERSGFEVVYANDIDPMKRALYAANRDVSKFVHGDVRLVHGDDVPDVELATASFPCIDLSLAGYRNGLNGVHSGTFWEFIRILGEMEQRRPRVVLIENVAGFVSSAGGDDLVTAIAALNSLGYTCDVLQIDARRWVPQSRLRTLIVAFKGKLKESASWVPNEVRTEAVCRFAIQHSELNLQAGSLPALPQASCGLSSVVEQFSADDPHWWSEDRVKRFRQSLSPHQAERLSRLSAGDRITWRTAYRRTRGGRAVWEIREDDVAGCLRTARGGSSKQALVEAGCGEVRARWLTPREYAALMGAPDLNLSVVSENQALSALGDAVCVPQIEWLGANYLTPLLDGELTEPAREYVTAAY